MVTEYFTVPKKTQYNLRGRRKLLGVVDMRYPNGFALRASKS